RPAGRPAGAHHLAFHPPACALHHRALPPADRGHEPERGTPPRPPQDGRQHLSAGRRAAMAPPWSVSSKSGNGFAVRKRDKTKELEHFAVSAKRRNALYAGKPRWSCFAAELSPCRRAPRRAA